jgi:hypothetical protein
MFSKAVGACVTGAVVLGMAYFRNHQAPKWLPQREISSTATPSAETAGVPWPSPIPPEDVKWGAYVGWEEDDLADFEAMVGAQTDLVAHFVHWGNEKEFPSQYAPQIRDAGKTLVIYWEAKDYNVTTPNDPRFNFDAILAGNWDSYIREFAVAAHEYGGPIIMVPFNEMNDNVAPWDGTVNNNSPEKHIEGYRHVREIFRETAPAVQFGWAVNNVSVPDIPGNQIEDYYPGDEYVDIVGVDGFNFGEPWTSFETAFDAAIGKLVQYQKPIYIFSMGSRDGAGKAEWIRTGLGEKLHEYPVSAWIWFNENKSANGEYDWRVNSDPESLQAFQDVVQ